MPRVGHALGASPPVPGLRARGMLRPVDRQARDETLPHVQARHHAELRAGGRLELVLRRRDLLPAGASAAALTARRLGKSSVAKVAGERALNVPHGATLVGTV